MKKSILILLLLPIFVCAKANQDSLLSDKIIAIEKQFIELEKDVNKFDEKLNFQQKISEQTLNTSEQAFNKISTQLNVSTYWIAIFTAVFAIIGVIIGVYITTTSRKVAQNKKDADEIRQSVEKMLDTVFKAKEDVEKIQKDIDNNIPEIYKKIKREETVSLLDRLVEFPEDINHIYPLLLTRKLQKEDFVKLKEAFFNYFDLSSNDFGNEHKYDVLLFQNFLLSSIKDTVFNLRFNSIISNGFLFCSRKSIEESTSEFVKLLAQEGLTKFEKELDYFFLTFAAPRHMYNNRMYEIFFNNLKNREMQFELFDAIKLTTTSEVAYFGKDVKVKYGNLLFFHYANYNLNEQEIRVFEELKALEKADAIEA